MKTDFGLDSVRRSGPSDQQQYQRHCYAKAAHEAGLFEGYSLDEVLVANVWIDRGAVDKDLHVDLEPYDPEWVRKAGIWLDDVVYAYVNEQEARKEPPREMCRVVCGFFSTCRAYDSDVEGLLTAPEVIDAAAMYREGLDLEKAGKRLKDQAKVHLVGMEGYTRDFQIRWTHVNESIIPEQHRRAYDKIEVKERPVVKVKE
jgi:hypothetical protein